MVLGGGTSGIAKKILVSIDVMTDKAENALKKFERQTKASTKKVEKSVRGNVSPAQQKLDQYMNSVRGIGSSSEESEGRVRSLNDRIATFGKDTRFASDMASQFRMDMLSVMFAGMQLMSVFGGLIKNMFGFTGASDALGAALKSVMLPITMVLQPALLALSEAMIGLDRDAKLVIGAVVVFLALAGAVAFVGAQMVMLSGAISGLSISVFGLNIAVSTLLALLGLLAGGLLIGAAAAAVLKNVFNDVVAFLATVLAPVLFLVAVKFGLISAPVWLIVAAIGVLIGGLIVLHDEIIQFIKDIPENFGKAINFIKDLLGGLWDKIKEIFGGIINFLKRKASQFLSAAKEIGSKIVDGIVDKVTGIGKKVINLILKIRKKINNIKRRIGRAAANLGKKILDSIIKFVSKLPGKIFGFLTDVKDKIISAVSTVKDAALDIGSAMIDGIVNGIKQAPGAIMDGIKNVAPDWVVDVLGKAGNAVSGAVTSVTDAAGNVIPVNDFVMTPNGDVLKTAPDDFIFGTKQPGALAGGSGGDEITINIDAEVASDMDIRDLADEIEDRIDRRTGGRSNLGSGRL